MSLLLRKSSPCLQGKHSSAKGEALGSACHYTACIPSFDAARSKTAVAFHAKDDLPEVRFHVFDLFMHKGEHLRFHAVVCDKLEEVKGVHLRNETDAGFRYQTNELYERLMRALFGKFLRLAHLYQVFVARRGPVIGMLLYAKPSNMQANILSIPLDFPAAVLMTGASKSPCLRGIHPYKRWIIVSGHCSVSMNRSVIHRRAKSNMRSGACRCCGRKLGRSTICTLARHTAHSSRRQSLSSWGNASW